MSTITTRGVRRIAVLGVLAASALAVWIFAGARSAAHSTAPQSASVVDVDAPRTRVTPTAEVRRSGSATSSARRGADHREPWSGAATWQAEFGCLEATCAPTWNLAQSAEEAAWLHRNGYGGRSERVALAAMTDAQLRARFDAGDLVAGTVYHDRLLKKRDKTQGLFLYQLAARGSVLALYKLAHFYSRGPHANKYFLAASLRLAQMRGDRWAINEINALWHTLRFDEADEPLVDGDVNIMLRNIEVARREHGYPPLTIDIRPLPPDAESTAMVAPGG
jgi:hypothetical protein